MNIAEIISKIYHPKDVKLYNLFGINKLGKIQRESTLINIIRDTIEDDNEAREIENAYNIITNPITETIYRIFGKEGLDNEAINANINWETIEKCCKDLSIDPNENFELKGSIIIQESEENQLNESIRSNSTQQTTIESISDTTAEPRADDSEDEPLIVNVINLGKNTLRHSVVKRELLETQDHTRTKMIPIKMESQIKIEQAITEKKTKKRRYRTMDFSDACDPTVIWLYKKKGDKYIALTSWENQEVSWVELNRMFKYRKVIKAFLSGTTAIIRSNFKLRFPDYYENIMNNTYQTKIKSE